MHDAANERSAAPLSALLGLTFLASIGTGIFWNGLAFIAENDYGYDERMNFLLYVVMGVTYVAGALGAGPTTRRLERWLTPRAVLGWILLVQAASCLLPFIVASSASIWIVGVMMSVLSSMLWPIVESYLSSGRHGRGLRLSMGWWNLTWTSAVVISMLLMAPLMGASTPLTKWAIIGLAGLNMLALVTLRWFPSRPGAHGEEAGIPEETIEYPALLRSARVLLPLSYLLVGTISPLMPYLVAHLNVEDAWKTPATATWMIARVLAMAVMWRLSFWHGRWGTLLFAGVGMAAGFVMIVTAGSVSMLLAGLFLFGAAQGVVYFAALYYAMAVGRAAVDAGGMHEGLIGVGYAIGPMLGLLALALAPGGDAAMTSAPILIGLVLAGMAIASVLAVIPYLHARAKRAA